MESYMWKITDKALIRQIKTAKKGEKFCSPPFRLFNLTFELELYPNQQNDDNREVLIFLRLCGLPAKVESINMKRKYTFVEVGATHDYNCTITKEKMCCDSWLHGDVKTSNIQKLKEMTFKVDITLFNIFDKNGDDITDKYLKNNQMNNKKRDLNKANININPPKKRRKYSNNNNIDILIKEEIEELNSNNNNIDILINEISNNINELIELENEKQKQNKDFKNMYDSLNKINELINDKCNTLKKSNLKMTNEFNEFKQEIKTLNEKISIYNGTSNSIKNNILDIEQLNKLEKELMNGMQCISNSRQKLMELKNKCIACKDNNKNMVFIDGCNHIVLCMECENKMDAKQCPICRTSYTNARKMNL